MNSFNNTALDDLMKTNPPRLVVLFRRTESGNEEFQWSTVGIIPVISLIGQIIKLQKEVVSGEWVMGCDQPALVIAWDADDRDFSVFLSHDIPALPLAGMLETIKAALVESRHGQHAMAQQTQLVGPDGNSVR
jgi:hypothetical protein